MPKGKETFTGHAVYLDTIRKALALAQMEYVKQACVLSETTYGEDIAEGLTASARSCQDALDDLASQKAV